MMQMALGLHQTHLRVLLTHKVKVTLAWCLLGQHYVDSKGRDVLITLSFTSSFSKDRELGILVYYAKDEFIGHYKELSLTKYVTRIKCYKCLGVKVVDFKKAWYGYLV